MRILGVRIDNFSKKKILQKIGVFLNEDKFHQIATINPEFILEAQNDEDFKNILNASDLNVADGIGIRYAFLRFGKILKTRFTGVDLLEEILQIANKRKLSVFLAINKHGLSSYAEISAVLKKKYPYVEFVGEDIAYKSRSTFHVPRSTILLCNFGAPRQEKFLKSPKSAKIRLAMGVGGSFDFLVGKIRRAPKILQTLGLEWLWRFVQEPAYRAKRIFKAVVVFPIKILFSREKHE